MSKDVLKTIQNDPLYIKKKVVIPGNNADRHCTTAANAASRTDENLINRIANFQNQLQNQLRKSSYLVITLIVIHLKPSF